VKERILSVTIHDCIVQTFRAGGNGGQNQNKRDSAVRIIHEPSGAVAESREERSQLQNKKRAWSRLAKHPKMLLWIKQKSGLSAKAAAEVDQAMMPHNLRIDFKEDGKWVTQ
jgi:protein subunit release factor B